MEQREQVGLYDSNLSDSAQREALTTGSIPVAVYGLGKMGLPLAGVYAETTGNVTGVDVDPAVVETVDAGDCHVVGEPGLDQLVAEQVEAGRLEATTDGPAAAGRARIHVVIVPTLLDEADDPDLTTVESVADDVAAGLEPGDLVIAESTLPPGTCRDVLRPHLSAKSGLEPDEFGLAFCPERTSSGTALRDVRGQYPKVVGGVDDESTRAASVVYDELSDNDVHPVSDATTAEAVKVFEGVYRDVNIALANELGRLADELGISAREAFATANDLPMCQLHDPGPGVGGHCIPFYPHFLLSGAEEPLELTRTAREINDGMPAVVVDRLEGQLAAVEDGTDVAAGESPLEDATVVVLGITYRPGVEETRASPAIGVIDALDEAGADVVGVDPLVDPGEYGARAIDREDLPDESVDAIVLVTPHEEFGAIEWDTLEPTVIVDGRDALAGDGSVASETALERHRVYTLGGSRSGAPPRGHAGSSRTDVEPVDGTIETGTDAHPEPTDAGRTDGGDDV
ncbi:nucleotide sugar dehydrogenase [Natrarchaeobaculum aegyptiacum]|uniref:UDP-N-acetyl-D-mannosamine dehydrogenase n=1 Tax=Natrarchaeobaculum aegyptiacum TaxID=745377 RepID=A0A2Z2I3E2_9EURY|nr:nucleotide sugar dehydrogenase [Natrarchaeobaculum aegyptiacum]ARS91808.1 nucleotide sugar dehydrogenase [Natrarchaeobaculum aegyptiacum]